MRSSIPLQPILLVLILSSLQTINSALPPSDEVLTEISPLYDTKQAFIHVLSSPKADQISEQTKYCLTFAWKLTLDGRVQMQSNPQSAIEICTDPSFPEGEQIWRINPDIKLSSCKRSRNRDSFVAYTQVLLRNRKRVDRYYEISAVTQTTTETDLNLKFTATYYERSTQYKGIEFSSQEVSLPFHFDENTNTLELRSNQAAQPIIINTSRNPYPPLSHTIDLELLQLFRSKIKLNTGQTVNTRVTSDQLGTASSHLPLYHLQNQVNINNPDVTQSTGSTSAGSSFAHAVCSRKLDTMESKIKRQLYTPHFHNCGDDEYLHLSYTLPEGKGTEVVMVVADGVGGSHDEGRDPGLLTLNMMKILYRFISLYPGWSPMDYLGVLLLILSSKATAESQFEGMFHYIFSQGHGDNSPSTTQYWAKYLDVYMNHLGQGSSTLSMFKYNTNTYSFSYANIGDSGFIVLRKDNDDNYKVVMKSNRGQIVANTPYQIHWEMDDIPDDLISRAHSDEENDKSVRYGMPFEDPSKYLNDKMQAEIRNELAKSERTSFSNYLMINVLSENSPASKLPEGKLQRGDVIIGASDGLLDNLHDVEVEAHVTLAARNLPPNGNEGTSSDPRQRLQKEIAEVLKRVVVAQMGYEGPSSERKRKAYLFQLSTRYPNLLAKNTVERLAPIPFKMPSGVRWYAKDDDLTIVVSVVA